MICASCNGSGKYIGLSSSEDCKDCLGKGTIIDKKQNSSDGDLYLDFDFVNRTVYFLNGKAIGTSFPPLKYDKISVIAFPTDHYDYIGPIKFYGKTEEEIIALCNSYKNMKWKVSTCTVVAKLTI